MRGDIFAAGVMAAILAVLIALALGFFDSGGQTIDGDHTLEWDEYKAVDADGMMGWSGAVEVVTVGGEPYVHAASTGYGAVVYEGGRSVTYRVTPAHADLILMDGQSNSAYFTTRTTGQPDPALAVAPDIGTAWYLGRTDGQLMAYDLDQDIDGYGIHGMVAPDGTLRIGDKGPTFASYYNGSTGHKVLWASLGIINQPVSSWAPGTGACWAHNMETIGALHEALDGIPIVIDRCVMFWAQGESDYLQNTGKAVYMSRFLAFWEAAQERWGLDIEKCYMVDGRTYRVGWVNEAFADLAAERPEIEVSVPAGLVDTFTVTNGLMYGDNMHYRAQGDNAVAVQMAYHMAEDLGYTPRPDIAPVYLMQTEMEAAVGESVTAPAAATCYRTDGTRGLAHTVWESQPSTAAEGTFRISGTATIAPSLLLEHAVGPYLIVTVGGEAPPEPDAFTVSFAVATDSIGYGSVSIASLADVIDGTAVTVGQTIVVGSSGQCTATPATDTAQYSYAFAGWTGADDSSTQAPTVIDGDVTYYAHFTRTVQTYTATFAVASDSTGYGTVSVQSVQGVPYGTSVTVAQTIAVGAVGQCTATPSADTAQYEYAFSNWTGADDSSTAAPTVISGDTSYYAHFTRTVIPQPMDPSLFTFTVSDGEATVTGWAGTPPADGYDLWLPTTDGQGHPLTAIGGSSSNSYVSVFAGAATVRADSVVTVGDRAFRQAALLESASLPSATTLVDRAFYECTSLASVDLPAATSIGNSAFSVCTSLASVSLPSATSIGTSAFYGCTALASVSLPSATSIGNSAFYGCTGIEAVTFGPLTGTLNTNAFPAWTFYDTNGTTVLSKTAANLKNSTFQGTASALIKVAPGAKSLSPQMQEQALKLAKENQAKLEALRSVDKELADLMDPSDVARMPLKEILRLDKADAESMKAGARAKASALEKEAVE